MKNWRNSFIVVFLAVFTISLAGCCAFWKSEPPASPPAPMAVAPAPEPVVVEEKAAVVVAPVPTLAESAAAAGALQPVHFGFDLANTSSEAVAKLDRTAAWMQANPEVRVQIAGHCDERGTNEYNMALGERRAKNAKKYLVDKGISADRLSTISYGEEMPVDPGHNEAAWAKNRRADFHINE